MPAWTITGLPQTMLDLQRLQHGLRDSTPQLKKGLTEYHKQVEDVFNSEGGVHGIPVWESLSPQRIQERHGLDHPILEFTSDLKNAATQTGIFMGQDISGSWRVRPRQLTRWLAGEKTIHDQGGINATGNRVPQRQFWPWHDEQELLFFKPFEDFVDDWLRSI